MKKIKRKKKRNVNHKARRALVKEHLQDNIHEILTEEETISSNTHKQGEQMLLLVRNGFVFVAAALFIASFFSGAVLIARSIAYILGALAYLSELLILTDCFSKRVPHNELFMVYCFGPLYILMGIGYFVEALA